MGHGSHGGRVRQGGAPSGRPFLESLTGKQMEGQASLTEDASFWVPSEGPLGARALEEGVVSLSFMAPALWNSLGLKFPVLLGLKCCNHCWV